MQQECLRRVRQDLPVYLYFSRKYTMALDFYLEVQYSF